MENEYAPYTWNPAYKKRPGDTLFSDRGAPLITQHPQDFWGEGEMFSILTIERYCKWYNLFIIDTDGKVHRLLDGTDKDFESAAYNAAEIMAFRTYCDHCWVPIFVVELAISLGARMELQVYDMICRRWHQDITECPTLYTIEFSDAIALELDDPPKQRELLKGLSDGTLYPTTQRLEDALVPSDGILLY